MRPISPGDGYVCLLDSKRPVFRWQLAMVIQAFIHAYLEDGNELFLHCCMRMAGPWWRWRRNPDWWSVLCVSVGLCVPSIKPCPSIRQAGRTFSRLQASSLTHTDPHTYHGKCWHTTSHPPASRLVPNNLFPSLRDPHVYFGCSQLNGLLALYYWWLHMRS